MGLRGPPSRRLDGVGHRAGAETGEERQCRVLRLVREGVVFGFRLVREGVVFGFSKEPTWRQLCVGD